MDTPCCSRTTLTSDIVPQSAVSVAVEATGRLAIRTKDHVYKECRLAAQSTPHDRLLLLSPNNIVRGGYFEYGIKESPSLFWL